MRAATPLLLALLLSACSPLVAQPAQTAGGSIQELTRQIDAEIGTPRCSADAQCSCLVVEQCCIFVDQSNNDHIQLRRQDCGIACESGRICHDLEH